MNATQTIKELIHSNFISSEKADEIRNNISEDYLVLDELETCGYVTAAHIDLIRGFEN